MARTDLTVQSIGLDGFDLAATLAAANVDGHAVINNSATFLAVKNADASGITVTLTSPLTVDGLDVADKAVSVGAGETRIIWLGRTDTFNQRSGTDKGKTYVDFSAVTNITVAAFRKA